MQVWEEINYMHSFKVSCHDITNCEGKNHNSTVEKSGRHHLNWLIKVNITINKIYQHHVLLYDTEKSASLLRYSAPKMYSLTIIMRKHETNPNWGIFYKITQYSSKVSRSWKNKDRLRNCKGLEETNIWQLSVM